MQQYAPCRNEKLAIRVRSVLVLLERLLCHLPLAAAAAITTTIIRAATTIMSQQ